MKRTTINLNVLKNLALGVGIVFLMTGCAQTISMEQCVQTSDSFWEPVFYLEAAERPAKLFSSLGFFRSFT